MTMKNDVCGIYMIENKNTKQRYIGQSIHIYQRWNEHINKPQLYMYIDKAIAKHGVDNFELKVICELEQDDDLLNEMEKYYIWKYNTYENDFHYNLTPGGDFCPMKVPEIAAKISGENHPFYGHKHTPETKAKISKAMSGENNPFYGKKLSEKHRKKISEAKKGKKHLEKIRKKISESRNTSGYYRVSKHQNHRYKQGFQYVYQYYDDDKKRHKIYSVDIKKLEKKVRAKGLEWFKWEE